MQIIETMKMFQSNRRTTIIAKTMIISVLLILWILGPFGYFTEDMKPLGNIL